MLNWEKSVRLKNIAMHDHLPAARHAVWRLCRADRGKHGITSRVLHAQDRNALGAGKQASTHRMASIINEMATMITGYHRNVAPLETVVPLGRVLSAITATGTAVVALPADHLLWTEKVADAATWLVQSTKTTTPGAKFQLWLLGDFSAKAEAELQGMGWELYSNAQAALLPNKAGKG